MRLAVRPRRPVLLRKRHWLAVAGMLALSLLAMPAAPAQAHFTGTDSVDGREIRYEDYTRFDEARLWAIQSWNALGSVKIAPDKWNTVTDLEFRDERRCDLDWGAWWQARKGADVIVFNTCVLEGADPLIVRSVVR